MDGRKGNVFDIFSLPTLTKLALGWQAFPELLNDWSTWAVIVVLDVVCFIWLITQEARATGRQSEGFGGFLVVVLFVMFMATFVAATLWIPMRIGQQLSTFIIVEDGVLVVSTALIVWSVCYAVLIVLKAIFHFLWWAFDKSDTYWRMRYPTQHR